MLIVLEDLHAADEASLLLLRFLGEAIGSAPIAVLCSYRDDEPRVRELASLFGGLTRVGRRIPLRGLSQDEVEAYVAGVVGGVPHVAARRTAPFDHRRQPVLPRRADPRRSTPTSWPTGSVPGMHDPGWRIPEQVRAVIRRRIDRLSPEASSLLQLAAVGGRELDFGVLERMSRLDASRLVDALGEALEAGLLVEDVGGQRQAFAHELVRETLYGDLSARRRAELHLQMGARPGGARPRRPRSPPLRDRPPSRARGTARRHPEGRSTTSSGQATARRRCSRTRRPRATTVARSSCSGRTRRAADRRRCDLLLRLGDAQWRAGDVGSRASSFEDATERRPPSRRRASCSHGRRSAT